MAKTVKGDSTGMMDYLPAMPNPDQTYYCFSSPEALATHVESCTYHWHDSPRHDDDSSHYGASYDNALAMCRDGWKEGADKVAALRDKITPTVPVEHRFATYAVAGATVDIGRYIAGNPACMLRHDTVASRRRPVITLVNHMGGLAEVDSACFVNKCATVAAIVDAIESAGFSCHVIGVSQSYSTTQNGATDSYLCGVAVTVKEAGDVVDVSRMAYALGHVSMFRRLVFCTRTGDDINRPLGSALGRTCDFVPGTTPADVYVLPSMNVNEKYFRTEKDAATVGLAHLVKTLAKQGCPAFQNHAEAA